MTISLYVGRMTARDIAYHLETAIGTQLSHDTISKITDEVLKEVASWQERLLEESYPILYLDAIVIKVRDGYQIRNKAAHMAFRVTVEGVEHLLGIWVSENEGAKFWAQICAQLANRGVKDVLIACCDRLTGFHEAIEATSGHGAVLCGALDLRGESIRVLHRSKGRQPAAEGHLHGAEYRSILQGSG